MTQITRLLDANHGYAAARAHVSDAKPSRKLAVLTGDLREQYEAELSQGGILDTYEQVSATTSYEVLDVGVQQVNEAQDTATVVVFGRYLTKSVTSGNGQAPEG